MRKKKWSFIKSKVKKRTFITITLKNNLAENMPVKHLVLDELVPVNWSTRFHKINTKFISRCDLRMSCNQSSYPESRIFWNLKHVKWDPHSLFWVPIFSNILSMKTTSVFYLLLKSLSMQLCLGKKREKEREKLGKNLSPCKYKITQKKCYNHGNHLIILNRIIKSQE